MLLVQEQRRKDNVMEAPQPQGLLANQIQQAKADESNQRTPLAS